MSAFSDIALPGGIPTSGGGKSISPDSLFKSASEKALYKRLVDSGGSKEMKISKVKVEIFDLSDSKQVRRYEKLWKGLLVKASLGEVVVDHHKDLVHRPDGTSYWMKYVEYVEFGSDDTENSK